MERRDFPEGVTCDSSFYVEPALLSGLDWGWHFCQVVNSVDKNGRIWKR